MKIYDDITKTVGTRARAAQPYGRGSAGRVVVKVESFNPLSSVKDRIGVAMIDAAEQAGAAQARRHHRRAHER
jgi:cysteine synthase A